MTELLSIQIAKKLRWIINRLRIQNLTEDDKKLLLTEYFWLIDYAEEEQIDLPTGMRLYDNYRKRNQRLRKRIKCIIQNESLFLTFTFTDATFETTSEDTRHKYVRRFLKSISSNYVANVDYGKNNGREHYHAVCIVNGKIDYTTWKYGALNGVKVRKGSSPLALAKYVNKLCYHATKQTTKQKIIYSRDI